MQLSIEKQVVGKDNKPKTRTFAAELLGYICADSLWEGGQASTDNVRPVWCAYAATEAEARAFTANLRSGFKADITHDMYGSSRVDGKLELLRSAGYRYTYQMMAAGDVKYTTVTAFLPNIFQLEPGMIDPNGIQFICLPPAWWVQNELERIKRDPQLCAAVVAHCRALRMPVGEHTFPTDDDYLALVPRAAYFVAYLEKRTDAPILDALPFHVQLYMAALMRGVAGVATNNEKTSGTHIQSCNDGWDFARHRHLRFVESGLQRIGYQPAVMCKVDHDDFDVFLASQIRQYFTAQDALERKERIA